MIVSDVVVFVELENIDEKWDRNKCFGPVVVVICGHTMMLVTSLVLRVPLGKPCDWRQGTPCSHYDNIRMRSHQ